MPGNSDVGATVISFTAEDDNGVSTSTTVCIQVSLKPIFNVPPTPPNNAHLIAEPGDTVSFTAEAFDPDPNDSVTVNMVNGKDAGGATVPLYGGADFMPLPTPWGNPTSGMFEWMTSASEWGEKPVVLTAEDGNNETTEHTVPILLNTPPQITSTPVTNALANNTYSYSIMLVDPDTAYGDVLSLHDAGLPSWLSLTDLGGGKGLLSGTPGPGDVGNHSVNLVGEDVYHHQNGTATQSFVISVTDTGSGGGPDTGCLPWR
ncbi:MAG: putative Ig domain-containing protein [Owenweeksia sp.]|nr:putative Ig domain-containing protein [Owenweeksia sp.]